MYSRAAGALEQVVYARDNKQFVIVLLQMDKALVGVYHLLKIYLLLNHMHKRVGFIILTVNLVEFIYIDSVLYNHGSEYATGKVTAIGNEIDIGVKAALQVLYGLNYFGQMLMGERLVDADIVVTPAEVCGCTRFYACTRAACDGIHVDIIVEHQVAGQRQQCQLDGSGKAAGIGYVLALADCATVQLGQSVYERIAFGLQAVIHGEVYHLQAIRQGVGLHELAGIAMSGAEKQYIDGIQRQLIAENHIGFTHQALMHSAQLIAGVAGTVYKNDLGIGMSQQDTYKFTGSITGSSYDSYFYHFCSGITSAQIR